MPATFNTPPDKGPAPREENSVLHGIVSKKTPDTIEIYGDMIDVIPPLPSYISTWRTTIPDERIRFPIVNNTKDIVIDFGDGTPEVTFTGADTVEHTFATPGDYVVDMNGDIGGMTAQTSLHINKLISVQQLGSCKWTSLAFAFYEAENLASFSAGDNDITLVTSTANMFNGCISLVTLDLSTCEPNSCRNCNYMVSYCTAVTSISMATWGKAALITTLDMFRTCILLPQIDLSGWDTSGLVDAGGMFGGCDALTSIDLSTWNTIELQDIDAIFASCDLLASIDVSTWDTSALIAAPYVFSALPALVTVDIASWNVSALVNCYNMFADSPALTNVDLSLWDVTNLESCSNMFKDCTALTTVSINAWETLSLTNISSMFLNCTSLAQGEIELTDWYTGVLQNAAGFMLGCGPEGMGTVNYDSTLLQWAIQLTLPSVNIDFGPTLYTGSVAQGARDLLTDPPSLWIITDGGSNGS